MRIHSVLHGSRANALATGRGWGLLVLEEARHKLEADIDLIKQMEAMK